MENVNLVLDSLVGNHVTAQSALNSGGTLAKFKVVNTDMCLYIYTLFYKHGYSCGFF